ncbi:tail assembly chaperone [Microbacterium phage Honk]|uniref:Tail assembly chaperone n=1 Tax=Microbacterium phage Honk TaxID=2836095 RepID=A0A8F3EBJ4_9CAUD|nr:tail assembly chaperone [Microbacterium phage Honk]
MSDSLNPVAAEALDAPIDFDFEGLPLSVLPTNKWSFKALDRFERGYATTFLSLVLTGDSYERLLDADPDAAAIGRLIGALQKAAGGLGKLTALARLLREAPDAVDADLQRFYGVDLADYYRGELSLRRLAGFLKHLPADSAVRRLANDGDPDWTREEYLLTHVYTAFTGKAHPWLPKASNANRHASLASRLKAQRARLSSS